MSRKVAFQMEPLEETDRHSTHTLSLVEEAQKRNYTIYHYRPHELALDSEGVLKANARKLTIDLSQESFFTYGAYEDIDLSTMDIIHMRQDPPVDMDYTTSTYLLERIRDKVLIVNDPFWVRNFPEKIWPYDFLEYMPPTLITRDLEQARAFFDEYGDVVMKPLYGFHGHGISRLEKPDDLPKDDLNEYFIFQKYLPEIKEGNKRIVLLDGEVAGSLLVKPSEKDFRIYRDSTEHKYEPNDYEKEMCRKIGEKCKECGLLFVGLDLIGDYITEINVTSVGSIRRLNALYDINFESQIWDVVESKL